MIIMKLAITVELKRTLSSVQHQPGISNICMGQEVAPGPKRHECPFSDALHLQALEGVSDTTGHLKQNLTFLIRQLN